MFTGFEIIKFIGVFFGSLLLDILWVFSVRRTTQGKYFESAIFSSLVTLMAGLIVIEYVDQKWLLIAATLGAFCGNYVTVKWDLVKHKNKF